MIISFSQSAIDMVDWANIARLVPLETALGTQTQSLWKHSLLEYGHLQRSRYKPTNSVNIKQTLDGTIFHAPSQSVMDEGGIPSISPITDIGIMHKLRKVDPSNGLLSELTE